MAAGKFLIGKPAGGVTTVTVADGATNTNLVLPESGTVSGVTTVVTDNAVPRFDGTTGKLQNSGVVIYDNDNVEIGGETTTNGLIVGNLGGTDGHISLKRASDGVQVGSLAVDVINSKITLHSGYGTLSLSTGSTEKMILDVSGNLLLTSGTGGLGYGAGAGGTVTQLTSKSTAVTLNKPTGRIIMSNTALGAGGIIGFVLNNTLAGANDMCVAQIVNTISNDVFNYKLEVSTYSGNGFFITLTNKSGSTLSEAIHIQFTIIKGAIA